MNPSVRLTLTGGAHAARVVTPAMRATPHSSAMVRSEPVVPLLPTAARPANLSSLNFPRRCISAAGDFSEGMR